MFNKSFDFSALLHHGLRIMGAALAVLALCASQAWAQYPNKPIRLVVPFTPGGVTDTSGRLIAEQLSKRLGQQVVVDNRAGANGIVGLQALMQAPPDGYTIGVAAAGRGSPQEAPLASRHAPP